MRETKATLRRALLERRAAIPAESRARASADLRERIAECAWWKDARVVSAFIGVRGEPDLGVLLEDGLAADKTVVLPRVRDRTHIDMAAVRGLDELVAAKFGLREPAVELRAYEGSIDLALVPGLAFGRSGERIGFGAGYYDRWIASLNPRPRLLGVCFAAFLDPSEGPIPMSELDARMDAIVSESELVEVARRD